MVDASNVNDNIEAQKELNQPEAKKTSENSENAKDAQNQSVEQETSTKTQSEQEKMLSQSEVNRIVGSAKIEAHERGKREALANTNAGKDVAATVDQNDPNKILIERSELEKIVTETAATQAEQQRLQQTCYEFANKIQSASESKKHADFDTTVAKLNLHALPQGVVEMTNALDNTADVLYELGKNPSKYASVLNLCNASPQLAYDELTRLSGSIKKNQDAAQAQAQEKINEPLDQVKPSKTGTGNGKLNSVSDFRKLDWLRG